MSFCAMNTSYTSRVSILVNKKRICSLLSIIHIFAIHVYLCGNNRLNVLPTPIILGNIAEIILMYRI
jgi:hypothetical protein